MLNDVIERRKSTRYNTSAHVFMKGAQHPTNARAYIPEYFEGEAVLKDISITGCHLESTVQVTATPGTTCVITIQPEPASKIKEFDIPAEVRWIRATDYSCQIGFAILESPSGKYFQRYVDYLSWRATQQS
ncbi:hypothetical protein FACS1894164_09290 [Spirochaetia bacterium]|nr:hypothetical protein FACS1894164_09290 [Spirochaetia bacterium]